MTPLQRQLLTVKAAYPDVIVLFRMGDFYEAHDNDAQILHDNLGITLLQRDGHPVCGLVVSTAEAQIAKLLEAGHKVVIADQIAKPGEPTS